MKSLFRFITYLRPYRGLVGLTFFFAALTTGLELVPPWLIKTVIDDVLPAKNMDLLFWGADSTCCGLWAQKSL